MKRATSTIAIMAALLAPSAVYAAGYKTTCARGGDARVIEVIAPGEVGQSCDVRYSRGANNVSVPYHADNSDTFCNEKARALTQRLASAGYVCTSAPPSLRAEAESQAPQSDYVVEAQRAAPQVAEAPAQEQEPAPPVVTAALDDDEEALEDEMSKILSQPSLEEPSREPAQLVSMASDTTQVGPQPSPVGRLTGADPDTPRPAVSATPAAVIVSQPAEEEASEPAPAPQTQPQPAEKKPALRTPAEIIRATLMASAAAWNEGDLDGFMGAYWKSDELKFVSGSEIARGWSATMKHYRDEYSGGQGLGQLSFERLEPKLVTDDVAVVTGRYKLAKDSENSTGLFSLVMRRDNGAWRIVHDHSNKDAPAE